MQFLQLGKYRDLEILLFSIKCEFPYVYKVIDMRHIRCVRLQVVVGSWKQQTTSSNHTINKDGVCSADSVRENERESVDSWIECTSRKRVHCIHEYTLKGTRCLGRVGL